MQTIQMHLSQKQKYFAQFLCAFFKSTSSFELFQKKVILLYISDITDSEIGG